MARISTRPGFTIIEVILFLAITGLMMVGIFAGISGGVNRQRYDDAAASFQDYMKGQYSLIGNVSNGRDGGLACSSGGVTITSPGSGEPRGTSDCAIVGRYVTTDDGRQLVSRPIYATNDITSESVQSAATESDQIREMRLRMAAQSFEEEDVTHTLGWQTNIYVSTAVDRSVGAFALAVVQLPTSRIARTYIKTGPPPTAFDAIESMILSSSSTDVGLCVNPDGLIGSAPKGVRVVPGSTNSNGVQYLAAGDGVCI